ncbi:MAG TPA: methionine gamma-lyase family protein [Candidatus Scatomorpha intestinigallinarum]|uniref:Methionine gamma-lyase family protein n=1 Tax=Candidatus Scatomorpha intestinigallinarum TaxID=2840923 RepID=A0A9D1DN81_9FIRM|nr:methionine gamma-lyase family protein [Candidatus Scatomorpha intestinigallinarum]
MKLSDIPTEIERLAEDCEAQLAARFAEIDRVARGNTKRVMEAFQEFRVSEACFAGTTGYGYDDLGRETLDKIWARVFGAEAALVRTGFVNGTHAIASALFAAVGPGELLMPLMGAPYDTLRTAIGITGDAYGSLAFYGVKYAEVPTKDGGPDLAAIEREVGEKRPRAVLIQRSRGYDSRRALSAEEVGELCRLVKRVSPDTVCVVDNCYGEFTELAEPTMLGADLAAGSLIKNPGGGLAPTGGYIAGRADLVEHAAYRLTVPGIGGECGCTLGTNHQLYQGLFLAPHTTAQALKTAALCAAMLEKLGFDTEPGPQEPRYDIIQTVTLKTPENLKRFCRGIQAGSPVDSYVTPEPWQMPGYEDEVIMAAGAFIQGSSIELSADGPMRAPYRAFLQGGLTYESGRLGIMNAIAEMLEK